MDATTLSPDTSLGSVGTLANVIDVVVTDDLDINQRQRVFALVNNGVSIDLYEITRNTENAVDAFNLIGQLADNAGNAILASTAIESNGNGSLYVTGYSADELLVTGAVVDGDILNSKTIVAVAAVPGTTNEVYVLTSDNVITHIDSAGNETVITPATDLLDIQGIAYDSLQDRLVVIAKVTNNTATVVDGVDNYQIYEIDPSIPVDAPVTLLSGSSFSDGSTTFNTSNSTFGALTFDSTNNQVLAIRNNVSDPLNVTQTLLALTFDDTTGDFAGVISNTNIISDGLAVTDTPLNVTHLTLHDGQLLGIHNDGMAQFLVAINPIDPSESRLLANSTLPAGTNYVGLSDTENGSLVIVTNDGAMTPLNSWATGPASLATSLYTLSDVNTLVAATDLSAITNAGVALTGLTDTIVSLAVDTNVSGTALYLVTAVDTGTDGVIDEYRLSSVNTTLGTLTAAGSANGTITLKSNIKDTGQVGVGTDINPVIHSADIRNGVLVAVASGIASDTDRQIIGVDLGNPDTKSVYYTLTDTLSIDQTLVGLSIDDSGNLFSLSSATGQTSLLTSNVQQALYTVSTFTGSAGFVGNIIQSNGDQVTDAVTAMSFSKAGDVLYSILRDAGNAQDRMVTISMTDGIVTAFGSDSNIIQVNNADTQIVALETSPTGNLLAYDDSQVTDPTTPGRRVIQVNLDDTETSLQVTTPDPAIDNVQGFAVDSTGRYFSFNNTTTGTLETRLYGSLNSFVAQSLFNGGLGAAFSDIADITFNAAGQVYAIRSATGGKTSLLYKVNIDSDSGEITSFDLINQISDATTGDLITEITAVDADPDSESLYTIGEIGTDNIKRLFRVDPSSGIATQVGAVTAFGTANRVETTIASMAWDNTGTMLLAVVQDFDGYETLIRINPTDATYTAGGSAAPDAVISNATGVTLNLDNEIAIASLKVNATTTHLWTLDQDTATGDYRLTQVTQVNGQITAVTAALTLTDASLTKLLDVQS
ncbi:MAG: hypothetical protein JKX85_09035 [Phycisphaeraceae bacterium]|nr:hypothetical protein [Phycisphaeraceae bacterium]